MGRKKIALLLSLVLLGLSGIGQGTTAAAASIRPPDNLVVIRGDGGLLLSWTPSARAVMLPTDKAIIQATTDFNRWSTIKTVSWWQSTQSISEATFKFLWIRVVFQRTGGSSAASEAKRMNKNFTLRDWDYPCEIDDYECGFYFTSQINGEYISATDSMQFSWEPPDYNSFFAYQMAAPTLLELSFSTPHRRFNLRLAPSQAKTVIKFSSKDYSRIYDVTATWTYQHGKKDSTRFNVARLPIINQKLKVIEVVTVVPSSIDSSGRFKLVSKTLMKTPDFRCAVLFGNKLQPDFVFDENGLGTYEFWGADLIKTSSNSIATIRALCWNKTYRAEIGPIRFLSEDGYEFLLSQ